jgi:hypothetical protein
VELKSEERAIFAKRKRRRREDRARLEVACGAEKRKKGVFCGAKAKKGRTVAKTEHAVLYRHCLTRG